MAPLLRHPVSVTIVALAFALTAGVFTFARPGHHTDDGKTIKIPQKAPAADAAGAAGWVWPDGVPGWVAGYTVDGYPVAGVQPVEAQPAALAAAHHELDASRLRVVDAEHIFPGGGPLAIFAAPIADASPTRACLGIGFPSTNSVQWRCPSDANPRGFSSSRVVAAVVTRPWSGQHGDEPRMFALVGLARGDVARVVLHVEGDNHVPENMTLYVRGTNWGQFETNMLLRYRRELVELRIYGDDGLVQTMPLQLESNEQRGIW